MSYADELQIGNTPVSLWRDTTDVRPDSCEKKNCGMQKDLLYWQVFFFGAAQTWRFHEPNHLSASKYFDVCAVRIVTFSVHVVPDTNRALPLWRRNKTCPVQVYYSDFRPSQWTLLFYDRSCHCGLKWLTAVEQNRFSVHTNTIIHGRSLFPGSSCEPLLPPLAIFTNKHFSSLCTK